MANGTRPPHRALCGAQLAYTMIVRVEAGWDRWALLLLCHRVTGYMVRSHAKRQVHFGSPVQGLRVEYPRGADSPTRCAHWIRAEFTLVPRLEAWRVHCPQEQLMFLWREELEFSLFHVDIYYCASIPGAPPISLEGSVLCPVAIPTLECS